MSKDKPKHATPIQTTVPNQIIKVYVYYNDGKGPGYFDGKDHKQGYDLHIQPVTVEQGDGFKIEKFDAFTGMKGHIEPATRYSAKRHQELADTALTLPLCKAMMERIMQMDANQKIVIAPGQPFAPAV